MLFCKNQTPHIPLRSPNQQPYYHMRFGLAGIKSTFWSSSSSLHPHTCCVIYQNAQSQATWFCLLPKRGSSLSMTFAAGRRTTRLGPLPQNMMYYRYGRRSTESQRLSCFENDESRATLCHGRSAQFGPL